MSIIGCTPSTANYTISDLNTNTDYVMLARDTGSPSALASSVTNGVRYSNPCAPLSDGRYLSIDIFKPTASTMTLVTPVQNTAIFKVVIS